ncbi:MAG: SDR family oxidoreductase [Pseudomonadota bacterium]
MAQIKAALVTGAGKRIGKAIALALAEDGYDVGVHYFSSKAEADSVVEAIKSAGRNAIAVQANLAEETQTAKLIDTTAEAIGPLSLLVNSASLFENDDLETVTAESWHAHLNTNLRAPLKLSQDFSAQTIQHANNLILNIIDQRVLKLTPQFLSYTVSKAALFTLTQTLAQTLGPKGVRVNGIGPGPILRNARQSEEDWRKQNEATVLGHGATPEDICAGVKYLIGAKAVTGQMIAIDGGQHLCWRTPDVMVNE